MSLQNFKLLQILEKVHIFDFSFVETRVCWSGWFLSRPMVSEARSKMAYISDGYSIRRCGPYFGTTVKANKTLKLVKKRQNILCFEVCRRKNFLFLSPSYEQSFKNREKSHCPTVLQLRWVPSTRLDENMTLFVFQHVTRYIETDFVEESRQKMQRPEKEHFFREGCFDRKEYLSNTANKRCSRQGLQLRCSSSYSIKFHT